MCKTLKTFVIFALLCSLVLFSSCSLFENDGSGHNFKVSLSSNPENLDPQIASDASSISVAKNMFVGLVRSSNGRIVLGVAKDYMISSDGLKYTFYLDERYKWKTSGDFEGFVTAHDFVFAFRRLFDAKTESPYAYDYFCISGSEKAYNGMIPLEEIGVKALDDYTLEFTLEYQNADFLYLLTQLPASPCNEEFFISCKGKYGLETETIASNGAFYVKYWLYDKYNKSNYIRLSRNNCYSDIKRVYPSGVTYLIDTTDAEKLNNFTDETTDILISSNSISKLKELEFAYTQDINATLGLVFNPKNEIFARKDIREVFSLAINRPELEKKLTDNLSPAYSIFPAGSVIAGSVYESSFNKSLLEYNKITAGYRWNFLLTEGEKASLYNINILVCDTFTSSDKLRIITDSWYDVFGIHFGIEVVNQSDYNKRIQSGDYDIAVATLSPKNGDVFGYISDFGSQKSYGFEVNEVKTIENTSGKYNTLTAKYHDYVTAESKVIEDYLFIPICHSSVYCFHAEDVADFEYDALTNTVIFENAKCY
ncbi:MAG: peptide ABC transporter substrate-binding protein [Oscillospiraceae bacterium]|nr:peptide ABC transporter substrate-binding protein [Oscillospiraceae bacterium]